MRKQDAGHQHGRICRIDDMAWLLAAALDSCFLIPQFLGQA